MTKYYIIEKCYVGPDKDQHVDADKIEISTSPAYTREGYKERTNGWCGTTQGWCGTTNDWAVYAYGEYDTIEDARAALVAEFGEVRDVSESYDEDAEGTVETYKMGKYAPTRPKRRTKAEAAAEKRVAELKEILWLSMRRHK